MKRNFNAIVRNFDGSPVEVPVFKVDPATGLHVVDERGAQVFERVEPLRLKKPIFELLGARMRGEEAISGAELLARYQLAMKIAAAGEGATELSQEDVKVLVGVLEKGAAPALYGQVKVLLDTDPVVERKD